MFEGRIRLPDSVVHAVFALEDLPSDVVDSRGLAGCELLVHTDGVPLYQALGQQREHLIGENWEGALRVQERAAALYPDEPGAWHGLGTLHRELAGPQLPDSIRTMLRSEYEP